MEYSEHVKNYAIAVSQLMTCASESCSKQLFDSYNTRVKRSTSNSPSKYDVETTRKQCYECINKHCSEAANF